MKVVLLGTGGPRPDPRRAASTTLIRVGQENILFDAGRGVVLQLVKVGIPLDRVNPVFVTHHHFDHIGDLYDVMLSSWMHGRKEALRIYGPPETRRIVDTLLTQVYDKDWQWRSAGEPSFGGWKPVVAEDIAPGAVVEGGSWKVLADRVQHGDTLGFSPAFLQRWTCLGYRLWPRARSWRSVAILWTARAWRGSRRMRTCWCTAAIWRARRSRTSIS